METIGHVFDSAPASYSPSCDMRKVARGIKGWWLAQRWTSPIAGFKDVWVWIQTAEMLHLEEPR